MSRGVVAELWEQWHYFNKRYFGGKLTSPTAIRLTRSARVWGKIVYPDNWKSHKVVPVKIFIAANCPLKARTQTLLHEMVHQYQIQIQRKSEEAENHCGIFRVYCKWIERTTKFKLR